VMDEVTKALPAYTWLVDLKVAGLPAGAQGVQPVPAKPDTAKAAADSTAAAPIVTGFEVNGRTVDIQAYTRFLRNLEASPWITDVNPVSAQTVVEQERAVTAFTIRAIYRQADSAYIRTVPLSQSVR
jgi:Tfp pilus assembly protein PilN